MLAYLQARAIPGVEIVENGIYHRTVEIEGSIGTVEVKHLPDRQSLGVTIRFPNVKHLPAIVARVRRLFDLGADIQTIDEHLSRDPFLAPLVASRPGLRAPGGWDGFELAIRAILGQQITVVAARRLAGQLVALHGKLVPAAARTHPALTHVFPTAKRLAKTHSLGLGMPKARQLSLQALAEAAAADPNLFRTFSNIEEAIARLSSIRGVGEWTAQYIALRALREMDAFPASDIGLLRCAAKLDASNGSQIKDSQPNGSQAKVSRSTSASLLTRAESWRPWRAYAAQHLWASEAAQSSIQRSTHV
jgi:AraC family transcriptional regulator of adaptative response / DNA-3-methyladenine glycosylase II